MLQQKKKKKKKKKRKKKKNEEKKQKQQQKGRRGKRKAGVEWRNKERRKHNFSEVLADFLDPRWAHLPGARSAPGAALEALAWASQSRSKRSARSFESLRSCRSWLLDGGSLPRQEHLERGRPQLREQPLPPGRRAAGRAYGHPPAWSARGPRGVVGSARPETRRCELGPTRGPDMAALTFTRHFTTRALPGGKWAVMARRRRFRCSRHLKP
ncbi:unnamed protein product [Prorocentrum cordatum]|uniref:Uncharacterized protein n=1 Tax=Prorocentrum cordatum TaxID=2364126 RepID=A0ABN9U204_9DINO|nr:unnamed protein product [Polarella glacialis]